MDKLYESAKTYAQILKNCSLPQVGDWRLDDVNRGFQWARYFNNVQSRMNHKPNVVRKLDLKLREIGREIGVRFGGKELSYDFLTDSSEYFTKCLLDNPALPEGLREEVLDYTPTIAQQHLSEATDAKLLVATLKRINGRLLECFSEDDSLRDLKSLDAEFLREDLSWVLDGGKSAKERCTDKVEERLCSLACIDGGMEVVLLCLLQDDRLTMSASARSHPDFLDPVRRAVFEWLMKVVSCCKVKKKTDAGSEEETAMDVDKEPDSKEEQQEAILDTLWHHDNLKLVAQVSLRYFDFFKAHVKFLVDKTRGLEKKRVRDTGIGVMMETGARVGHGGGGGGEATDPPLQEQVEWVTAHWVALARTGEQLREICISLLSDEANPFKKHMNELTYSGCSMKLPLPQDSIWTAILNSVLHTKTPQTVDKKV